MCQRPSWAWNPPWGTLGGHTGGSHGDGWGSDQSQGKRENEETAQSMCPDCEEGAEHAQP